MVSAPGGFTFICLVTLLSLVFTAGNSEAITPVNVGGLIITTTKTQQMHRWLKAMLSAHPFFFGGGDGEITHKCRTM